VELGATEPLQAADSLSPKQKLSGGRKLDRNLPRKLRRAMTI